HDLPPRRERRTEPEIETSRAWRRESGMFHVEHAWEIAIVRKSQGIRRTDGSTVWTRWTVWTKWTRLSRRKAATAEEAPERAKAPLAENRRSARPGVARSQATRRRRA